MARFRVGDLGFSVSSSDATAFAAVRRGCSDLLPDDRPDSGASVGVPSGPSAVVEFFGHLNLRVVDAHPAWTIFHAGAVEIAGRALVLFGLSGAGKSTLTAALVQRGAGYLTDEASLIEPTTALVHPYAKPLSLDAASLDLLAMSPAFGQRNHTEVAVRPVELGGRAARLPVPLLGLCRVSRGPGEVGSLRRLGPSEALMAMLPSYMCFDPQRNALAELSVLLRSYPVWELQGGSPRDNAEVLESLAISASTVALDAWPTELLPVDHIPDCEGGSMSHLGPFSAPVRESTLVGVRYVDGAVVLDRATGEHVQMSPEGFDVLAGLDGRTPLRTIGRSIGCAVSSCVEFCRSLAERGWLQGYPRTLDRPLHPHVSDRNIA